MNRLAISWTLIAAFFGPVAYAAQTVGDEPPALEQLEEAAIRLAVDRVRPAIVRIDLIGSSASTGELEGSGPTSGLIVSPEGHVLTSAFVFATPPASILVTLDDQRQFPATLVATDHSRHLALLKLEGASGLKPATIAPRKELAVGQWTIAVGRALSGGEPSVSVGVLSALERIQGKAVQTDAAISPANYGGPLIDITGRVIGVLTPLAPEESAGASGAEWYDSGIGFAVPLGDYEPSLVRLQAGEDLYRGLLGIAFEKGNAMESPPVIASVRPRGPAASADLRAGDQILKLASSDVGTQAILRRNLGRYYSGDTVVLFIQRDEEQLEVSVTLVRELEPFRHAALGIRTISGAPNETEGVQIAQLLPGGPASTTGLEMNDQIRRVDKQLVPTTDKLAELIQSHAPGDTIQLEVIGAGKPREVAVTLSERSAEHYPIAKSDSGETPEAEVIGTQQEIKLPEFSAACPIYLPSNSSGPSAPGLLVLLQSGKDQIAPDVLRKWQLAAEKDRLILAFPKPQEARGWSGQDIEYVKQLMRTLIERHQIDRRRVALAGMDTPNRVTLALWLANRDLVRGVILGANEMPPRLSLPENEPEQPCLLFVVAPPQDRQTAGILKLFVERGFSIATREALSPEDIAAWADSLDRL